MSNDNEHTICRECKQPILEGEKDFLTPQWRHWDPTENVIHDRCRSINKKKKKTK